MPRGGRPEDDIAGEPSQAKEKRNGGNVVVLIKRLGKVSIVRLEHETNKIY